MKIIIIGAREGLIDACVRKGIEVKEIPKPEDITISIPYNNYIWFNLEKLFLPSYDCIVLVSRNKRSKMIWHSLKDHIKIIGNPYSREAFDNKVMSTAILSNAGIPTIPLVYGNATDIKQTEELGNILVEKPDNLSRGKEVVLLNNPKKFEPNKIYQKYIECNHSDERWICVDNDIVCAMKRSAAHPDEFRSNLNAGGIGEKIEITEDMRGFARRILSFFPDYLYTGLDIIKDKNGNKYFLESNVVPGIMIIDITGHNYYDDICNYIISKIKL